MISTEGSLPDMHAKVSVCSLVEDTSVYPKQCKKLKLSPETQNYTN